MRHKQFLILALCAGLCRAQTVDLPNRRIDHSFENGRTTHVIGDVDNKGVFAARCKWRFFGGEEELEVSMPGVQGAMRMRNGKPGLRWTSAQAELDFVQDGDFLRWEITLDEKPPFTWYSMQFDNWDQYNWDYQPPFPNPEEFVDANDGQVYVRQYGLPDDPAPMIHTRLKSIDGGYVVWHKTKRWNKYRTGDVLSVHRPKMTDADGNVYWSTIDITNGLYTVAFPTNVWNRAKYPIVINDTFGETDASGWSLGAGLTDYVIGDWATPSSDGTGVSMHTYCKKGSGSPHLASQGVYDDGFPTALVTNAETPASANIGAGESWVQTDFGTGPSFTGSTQYQVAFHMDGTVTFYYTVTGASGRGWHNGAQTPSDGSMPTGFTGTVYTRRIATYCTYTPSGAAAGQVISIISN